MKTSPQLSRLCAATLLAALASGVLSACAPLIVGGAMVGSAMVAIDRRTAGTQLEDEAIELKAGVRAREVSAAGHINVTSYNRMLLVTGEVPNETDRKAVEQVVGKVENLRSVVNELAVAGNSALAVRSSDALISGKVKASFIDANDVQAQAIKVVTERGVVYLMGIVTEREAARATEIARAVSGVQKVVRVFEVISEAELAALQPKPAPR
jgi:osmotically-inducible protein OsmY